MIKINTDLLNDTVALRKSWGITGEGVPTAILNKPAKDKTMLLISNSVYQDFGIYMLSGDQINTIVSTLITDTDQKTYNTLKDRYKILEPINNEIKRFRDMYTTGANTLVGYIYITHAIEIISKLGTDILQLNFNNWKNQIIDIDQHKTLTNKLVDTINNVLNVDSVLFNQFATPTILDSIVDYNESVGDGKDSIPNKFAFVHKNKKKQREPGANIFDLRVDAINHLQHVGILLKAAIYYTKDYLKRKRLSIRAYYEILTQIEEIARFTTYPTSSILFRDKNYLDTLVGFNKLELSIANIEDYRRYLEEA